MRCWVFELDKCLVILNHKKDEPCKLMFAVELAEMLSTDMQKEGLHGRTLTLKLKTTSFEVLVISWLCFFLNNFLFMIEVNSLAWVLTSGQSFVKRKVVNIVQVPLRICHDHHAFYYLTIFLLQVLKKCSIYRFGIELWLYKTTSTQVRIFWSMHQNCWKLSFPFQ